MTTLRTNRPAYRRPAANGHEGAVSVVAEFLAAARSARAMTVTQLRPAVVCAALLEALDASEGRRRRRKRDTTPDAIGMSLKRQLLVESIEADPDPEAFAAWLLERCLTGAADATMGALRAMAREVLAEWQFAAASADFREWLAAGAPSEDRRPGVPAALALGPSSKDIDGR